MQAINLDFFFLLFGSSLCWMAVTAVTISRLRGKIILGGDIRHRIFIG